MISFRIPEEKLRHFLVACDMNFNMPKAEFIFHLPDKKLYEVVFLKVSKLVPEGLDVIARIDEFIRPWQESHRLWEMRRAGSGFRK